MKRLQRDPFIAFGENVGIPFDGKLDVDHFCKIPSADLARAKLAWIMKLPHEMELRKRHSPDDVARMWKAVFRACIAHGVSVPDSEKPWARALGVVFP